MLTLGAHVSISEGFDAAVENQRELGGTCGQLFVGSPRTWSVREVTASEADAFATTTADQDVGPWIIHGTYLINFATPKEDLAKKSIRCVQAEIDAAAMLNIPYYVFHPGAHTGAGEAAGIENVAARLSELTIPSNVTVLVENTAGKGTTVGTTMADLNAMIADATHGTEDLGVCLDTCHLYAAGYDFTTEAGMAELVTEISDTIGLDQVEYLHLNDSKHALGSEKDEHAHIGEGTIGEDGFRQFINHDALRALPMVLETPVDEKGYAWNIEKVQELYTDD